MYGVGDNFDLKSSHVLPALVKKFVLAKIRNKKTVEVWGSGKVRREFLNVDDLSEAIYFLIKKNIKYDYINIGGGEDFSIKQLAEMIKKTVNFNGKIIFNKKILTEERRKINSSIIRNIGWRPKIKLKLGLIQYCDYYLNTIMPRENLS